MSDRVDDLRTALSGRYEIERELGRGGMATVYLASDLRHHRQVAVKVLRPDLAAAMGPERFLREIDIAANLTHPHILPLHDSGEAGGFLYYVMPYIKGETLRERIEKEGELPISEVVRIIREVTDALAFAHSQGVVHRDIKPDNVMLSGRHAMVMDFGVAKAVSEATGRNTLTTAGVALGTPTYMAPEQATADPHVDHRADIYAVGVMAYELLAGRTPFQGASPQAVLAAHVTEAPDPVSKHRDHVSGDLEALVMKCLAKRPADRWQSADEMLPLLEAMAATSGGMTPTETRPIKGVAIPRRRVWWMALGAVAALVAIGMFGARIFENDGLSITVTNVRQITHSPMLEIEPELSPDGRELLYTAGYPGAFHLHVRSVEGGPALVLTEGLPGDQGIAEWHPSGASVEFANDLARLTPQFYRVSKFGGQLTTLRGYTMAQSDSHAWYTMADSVWQVDRESGATEALWKLPPEAYGFQLSPDRSRVVYVIGNLTYHVGFGLGNVSPSSIWVFSLNDSASVRVTENDGSLNQRPRWLGNDALLFVSNRDGRRDVYAVRLSVSGEAADVPVRLTTGADVHTASVSDDGSLMAYSQLRFRANLYQITLPESGSVSIGDARPLTRQNHTIENHDRSADGRWLTYDSDISGNQEIYVADLSGGEPRAITSNPAQDMAPRFSPDRSEILFYSTRNGSRDLFMIPLDGGDEVRLTGRGEDGWAANNHELLPTFSRDGLHISFMSSTLGPTSVNQLFIMSRDSLGGVWGPARLLADTVFATSSWAPDGHRLVFDNQGGGIDVVTLDGERWPLVDSRTMAQARWVLWADDNRVYFRGTPIEGMAGIFVVDMSNDNGVGSDPQLIVRFDEPSVVSPAYAMTLVDNSLVFTVDEKESDIFLMDLEY